MGKIEKSVFMSYRRTDMPWALAIQQNLSASGYDVFFDYESINSGDFEQIILGSIKARAHFIVLLTPTALERCKNPNDWLRREIETALRHKRNIVPVFLNDFDFGNADHAKYLTGNIATLKSYNGLEVPKGFFGEAMSRLKTRYLNIALDTVLHPVSNDVKRAVQQQQKAANKEKQIEQADLANDQYTDFKSVSLGEASSYTFLYGLNGVAYQSAPNDLVSMIKKKNTENVEFNHIELGSNNSYVFFYNYDGYAYSGIPAGLADSIKENYGKGFKFKSVSLGENDSYVFLYGRNGVAYQGIPNDLIKVIKEQNKKNVEFNHIALGPNNSYVFFYNHDGYAYSNIPQSLADSIQNNYGQGHKYKSVALGEYDSYVFLYGINGYAYGSIHKNLAEAIKEKRG